MTTSLLEALNTDRTVADKARFVDYFVGDSLRNWWTENDIQGANTAVMSDTIDGGVILTTGTTSADRISIDFNDKRPFDATGFILHGRYKVGSLDNFTGTIGVEETENGDMNSGTVDAIACQMNSSQTYIILISGNGTQASTSSSINRNTQWNNVKLQGFSGSSTLDINGSLQVTHTSNLPTTRQQPFIYNRTSTTGAKTLNCNYIEVYNT